MKPSIIDDGTTAYAGSQNMPSGYSALNSAPASAYASTGAAADNSGAGKMVKLRSCGPSRLDVIRVIRTYTGWDLKPAKELAESAPAMIPILMPLEKATQFVKELESFGAIADVI